MYSIKNRSHIDEKNPNMCQRELNVKEEIQWSVCMYSIKNRSHIDEKNPNMSVCRVQMFGDSV